MTSYGIPSRPPGKLFTEFQLEFWEIQLEEMEKEQDQKNVMMETKQIVMDAAAKDDVAIVMFWRAQDKNYGESLR